MVHSWHFVSVSVVNKYLVIHPTIHSQIFKNKNTLVVIVICLIYDSCLYLYIISNRRASVKIILDELLLQTKKRFKSKSRCHFLYCTILKKNTNVVSILYYKCLVKIFSLFHLHHIFSFFFLVFDSTTTTKRYPNFFLS